MLGVLAASRIDRGDGGVADVFVPTTSRPVGYPPVDEGVQDAPLGTPPPVPDSPGPYEFIATQDRDGAPVTWDPCRPIRYVMNPDGAPPGAESLVDEAIARVSAATGLVFVDEGTTDETWTRNRDPYQPDHYGERWAPVLLAWSTDAETPALAGYIAGQRGPIGRSAPGGADNVRSVIQHELGHLVGLDHVADPGQLMFSESSVTDWGSGDLAGLHELGSAQCHRLL